MILKRFDCTYRGSQKAVNSIYDLVHESSLDVIKSLIENVNDTTIHHDERHIAILQNITVEDETQEHRQNIGTMIFEDKLQYFNGTAFTGYWKSGACVILTLENMMGQLIKNKVIISRASLLQSCIENMVSLFEEMYELNLNCRDVSK